MPRIPDLPGMPVAPRSEQEQWLRQHVARLCQLDHERFPGSQPVSFATKDIEKLESQDYWVCEKSDGVRVLLLVQTDVQTKEQAVFIIDRHNTYRLLAGLYFPHHENPVMPLRDTIVDGELVIDVDPRTKQETLRYLAFDCLVVDSQNVMSRTLDKRYGRLQEWFYKPYAKMLKDHPQMAEMQPFQIRVKDVKLSYHVDDVFEKDIPALQHGNDGLIYTCVNTPYVAGTDPNILKWKPPSENSIDFKLVLRFPPSAEQPNKPDPFAKPVFELHVWCGGKNYEFWDVMLVTDEEWESMKSSGEQFDDRIVEVHWDPEMEGWRMMRFRDDKPNGNHKDVVANIVSSIADGIEKDELLVHSNAIRNAWKHRQGQAASVSAQRAQSQKPPTQQSQQPLPAPLPPTVAAYPQQQPPPQQRPPLLPPAPAPPPLPPTAAALPPAMPLNRPRSAGEEPLRRYGPIAPSALSRASGPVVVAGVHR